MTVSARAVAVHGLGFGALSLAVLGLVGTPASSHPVTGPTCSHFTLLAATLDRDTLTMTTCSIGTTSESTSDADAIALATASLGELAPTTASSAVLESATSSVGVVEACAS